MFHPALWKLMRFQWRGGFRQLGRSLRTWRGLFFAGFIVAMSLYGLGSVYVASRIGSQSPQVPEVLNKMQNDFLPLGLFIFTFYTLVFSTGEATVYFSASEAAFLFPAPITRKQLLAYLLLKSLLGIAGVSLFFGLFMSPRLALAVPRWLAVIFTLSFLQLLTMNVSFLRQILEEKLSVVIRRLLGLFFGVLVLTAITQTFQSVSGNDFDAYLKVFRESTAGKLMLAPFFVFVRALTATDWQTFIPYAAVLLAIDLALLLLAFRLDALSLEAALAISEKMTERLKLMQSKGAWHAFESKRDSSVAQRKIPQLPFWGGVGPVLWQRMTTTFRSSSRLLWVLAGAVTFAAGLVYLIGRSGSDPARTFAAPLVGLGSMAYMSFLICLSLQNEIERVGYLKSLPIRPIAVVIGDLIGFPILLSVIQSTFITVLACFFTNLAPWLLCGAILTLPLNLLLFEIDKLVFYIYPTRLAKGAPGDFQNSGKQMIFMTLKMLMLGAAGIVVIIAALPGALALQSPVVAVACAGFVLVIECGALVPLLIIAYDRFDPSTTIVQ